MNTTPADVITGNADLEQGCTWSPPAAPPERPTLPGHEHQLDADAPKAWPWLTERRAFALSWACALLALAFRMGWL